MNSLAAKYGDKLNILAFPCNQFGHQTNEDNAEIMNTLKYVRPGNGFAPADSVTLFEKGDVNGSNAQPVFKWLKSEIAIPNGEKKDTKGNGCLDEEALVLPRGGFGSVHLWSPVTRSDIAWNFEKFLLDSNGKPVKRYHRYFDINEMTDDIDQLL